MEQFSNNAQTTLNGTITSGATSLVVTSATTFPTSGNFRLLIDSEYLLTTVVSGTTFTVTRGIEGSTPAAHNSGATVTEVLTAGALSAFRADTNQYGTLANRPSAGNQGVIYYATDTQLTYRDNGSSWDILSPPATYLTTVLQKPVLSNFTIINQGTATISNSNAGIVISDNAASDNWRIVAQTAPTPPYAITFLLAFSVPRANFAQTGVGFRNTTTGGLSLFVLRDATDTSYPVLTCTNWSSPTTYVSTNGTDDQGVFLSNGLYFFKIRDDGTNVYFYHSPNGVDFILHFSVSKSSGYLGSTGYNQIYFSLDPTSGLSEFVQTTCMHFAQSVS